LPPKEVAAPASTATVVAATVDGEPVFESEVRRELARAVGERPVDDASRPAMLAATLEQIINRRLVYAYLVRQKRTVDRAEIDRSVERLKQRIADRKVTWADHLTHLGQTEEELRRELAWQSSWQRFVDREITDEALEKYFRQHRRDYDGTQVRVSQILLRPVGGEREKTIQMNRSEADAAVKASTQRAEQIRREVVEHKMTFADAARRYSDAPSKDDGGDLGFIARRGENVEEFSRAAFALDKGQTSPPVVTPFGVHLIQCTDVRPGTIKWTEVRDEVRRAAIAQWFHARAAAQRVGAKIEYTGAAPWAKTH
jgi:parvulin-like peptidyl-prolyl isomerase